MNALEDPFIPVRDENGVVREVGIREALLHAHEIAELADASPLAVVSQLRLLLAVMYRVFQDKIVGEDVDGWLELYNDGAFPAAPLEAYFAEWHDRFDLFHPQYPFMQVAALTGKNTVEMARLTPELALSGMFDNHGDAYKTEFTPAEALRMLLVSHNFGLGGLLRATVNVFGADTFQQNTNDGTIARGLTLWLGGKTLFHSLLLNAPPPEKPDASDAPCWEWNQGKGVDAAYFARTYASGPQDRFTSVSRIVRFLPEQTDDGQTVVPRIYFTQGRVLDRELLDPMHAYRNRDKEGRVSVRLGEDKATWRDLSALLQINQAEGVRPDALAFTAQRCHFGELPRDAEFALHVTGMCSDQQKVFLWRHDRVGLPAAFLAQDKTLVPLLAERLSDANDLAAGLWGRVRGLCEAFLSPVNGMMKPDPKNVAALAGQIDPRRTYWAHLETHLPALLETLTVNPDQAKETWREQAKTTARDALDSAIAQLGPSPRAFRAAAAVSDRFYFEGERNDRPVAPAKGKSKSAKPGKAGA